MDNTAFTLNACGTVLSLHSLIASTRILLRDHSLPVVPPMVIKSLERE